VLADRAKGRIDLLKNAEATQWRVTELEQELKQVREAAAVEKKKLENELAEEKRKTQEANAQFNAVSIGKVETLCRYPYSRVEVLVLIINFADFRKHEEDLNNDLKNTKEKVRSL
jgi:hypothetical protein